MVAFVVSLKKLFVKKDRSPKKTPGNKMGPAQAVTYKGHKRQNSSIPGAISFLAPKDATASASSPTKPPLSGAVGAVWEIPPLPALPPFAMPKTHFERALEEVNRGRSPVTETGLEGVKPVKAPEDSSGGVQDKVAAKKGEGERKVRV
ncbi:hypothetical protein L202_06829 [Cryptococcus amylolentus CBS 6039]|uniref:Uncharacterized protein n=1 Tax=Cryptococcus amylolentus CBS 6039 TaxID=1295533 RepID=A0A1E3HF97_9TREE|nr:hypothetical protein L202_06829 [Cryptococcus amylolentus CBS 6039]ODN74436.1 hypothetical protein L202_06829 [Cryptococcus amylolentus CBS 6039]